VNAIDTAKIGVMGFSPEVNWPPLSAMRFDYEIRRQDALIVLLKAGVQALIYPGGSAKRKWS
jgi:hypothetical protein